MLEFLKNTCKKYEKPIAMSFICERRYIEKFKSINTFPVFNDPVESIRALRMLRDYWKRKE